MNTCSSCANWSDKPFDGCEDYRGCYSDKFTYLAFSLDCKDMREKDNLVYSDSAEDVANVMTGKDFGCIHWEAK